ncbi:hypothetical protein FQN52_003582 [Onygenales sp. PD_12]|nr:hypothetical protein FQN52_003582 [Onygenales sp. PD_12]
MSSDPGSSSRSSSRTSTRPSSRPTTAMSDISEVSKMEMQHQTQDPEAEQAKEVVEGEAADEVEEEDEEGMDVKTKALTNLLKTSSVFVAIMADKMKDQQKKQQEEARRKLAKQAAAAATADDNKTAPPPATASERRSTRASGKPAQAEQPPATDSQSSKGTKLPTRARPKKPPAANSISNYFKKADVEIKEDNPTVQEALEQAADEYEAKPTALGEQELVATQQPALVTGGQMREYQLEGLEWLKSLWMNGLCGILADEMGLGKTVQAISLIAFFKEHNVPGPFLISAPLSTVSNWVDEFARWTPGIETVLYHGSKDERAQIRDERMKLQDQKKADFPVVVTSYEICMNDRKFLAKYQWKYIIVDEGHRLKNLNCRLIKELLTYNSANRLLITGTPLQNNIAELWSLLHFLLPEVFNDVNSFESWFDFSSVLDNRGQKSVIERRKRNLVSTMHAILKPFLLRRVKTDVESSLPKKREYILYAPLTPDQKDLYLEIMSGSSRKYLEEKAVERINARNGLTSSSRAGSLKRKASSSGSSTPNKSLKSSRDTTPGSTLGSGRRRRGRLSYKDVNDREFDAKLRRLERGIESEPEESEHSEAELEEIERTKTADLAKKEISSKKLQNPVMQARLACNSPHNFYWPWSYTDPSTIDNTLITSSGKMLILDRLIPRLIKLGHKILIFSQFKTQLDILQDYAVHLRGWNCCRIDGAVSQSDRQAQIRAFNTDPEFRIFLLSTRAGGQGINLTAADTVILFDSDWNPQQDLQAQDRAHRIGQTRPVIVYRLATKGTVEQTLLEKADSKRKLEKLVIQKGKFKSLLDKTSSTATAAEAEELRRVLGDSGFEVLDVGGAVGKDETMTTEALLSERDLQVLTDRSAEAYERAEKGEERGGHSFAPVEKTGEAEGIMKEITMR